MFLFVLGIDRTSKRAVWTWNKKKNLARNDNVWALRMLLNEIDWIKKVTARDLGKNGNWRPCRALSLSMLSVNEMNNATNENEFYFSFRLLSVAGEELILCRKTYHIAEWAIQNARCHLNKQSNTWNDFRFQFSFFKHFLKKFFDSVFC